MCVKMSCVNACARWVSIICASLRCLCSSTSLFWTDEPFWDGHSEQLHENSDYHAWGQHTYIIICVSYFSWDFPWFPMDFRLERNQKKSQGWWMLGAVNEPTGAYASSRLGSSRATCVWHGRVGCHGVPTVMKWAVFKTSVSWWLVRGVYYPIYWGLQ